MYQSSVRNAQTPLRLHYETHPEAAMVTDHAKTSSQNHADPFHANVSPMPECGQSLPVGVHRALGGQHDAPTPGDVLCAALAACMDSSLRMVANTLGVELSLLEVEVNGDVDVRGTMLMSQTVPVGFQQMRCNVRLLAVAGTDPARLEKLTKTAEHCCVVLQTLRNTPSLQTTFDAAVV